MLSDAQWAVLEPLVEACRPKAKTPPQDLRRTLSAILWRHQNGAKWRAIPQDLGPWWRAAQIFIRWSRGGGESVYLLSCRSAAFSWAWCSSMAPICVRIRRRLEPLKGGICSRARRS
jgi:transposase